MNKKDLAKFLEDEKRLHKHVEACQFDGIKDWMRLMNIQGHDALKTLQQKVKRLEKENLRLRTSSHESWH